jgi:hypothetical protein
MERLNNSITTFYLRNLLNDLTGRRPVVGIRLRMLGEMWKPNFMSIVSVTDRGAVFIDDSIQEFVFVPDLSDVVQFELEDRFNDLQPHFHYEVNMRPM